MGDMTANKNTSGDNVKIKIIQNGAERKECYDEFTPPDGGARSWLVMLGSFFCNGILFGVINSYSILYKSFHDNLEKQNVTDATSKAALIGSLAMGTVFFVSPVSGVLTDFAGIRTTTFMGGLIASTGMLLSSFCVDNVVALYFTYGIMYGLGGALAYTPSLAVLGHYFKKKLGLVNGLVTAGSSAFTITMPYLISIFLEQFGIEWTLRIIALMSSFIMLFAFLFKPVNPTLKFKKVSLKDAFNVSLFRNQKYVIYATIVALSLCGYFVPYVYMVAFVHKVFGEQVDAKLAVSCIGIASGFGRLVFGFIGDHPKINRIFLQQLSFLVIGISTILLPSSGDSYGLLIVLLLFLGLFDGCFISILGPIAFDICGAAGATQAIGFLLGLCAIPLTVGPYIAGLIYESTDSYTLSFVLAGIPPVIGSVAMFLTRCVKADSKAVDPSSEMLNQRFDESTVTEQTSPGEEERPL
ncbi:monocarboxylate transporter 10 isoform X2 [Coccinella septempunctata]|uniref:monocarboxylate transporter 10 isoform X2 n=1 Tax=Coccinella septempunctata TaxID=41139 RepID=UPI001D081E49|nr:monocarboxylate transporter 10 isoform X2 [Coccinella septempunctata]